MSVLGIVPARRGSARLPDKHLEMLLGKPMFSYTLEAMKAARGLDRLVVSSDDERLAPLAESYGIRFLARPAELASATSPLDDAIRHACAVLQEEGFQAEVVLVAQGNVPLRKAGQIDEALQVLRDYPSATAVCTAGVMKQRPEWSKIIVDRASGACKPWMEGSFGFRFQDMPDLYVLDGSIYCVRRDTLEAAAGNRTAHAWFGPGLHLLVQDHPMYSLEVDFPEQLEEAQFYLLKQKLGPRLRQELERLV